MITTTTKKKKTNTLEFVFKTYSADFLGINKEDLYIKIETKTKNIFIVLKISQSEYIKLLKEYFKEKKRFCDMYGHFCGAAGYHVPCEVEQIGREIIMVNSGSGDVRRYLEVPLVVVSKWSKPDMEHG
jgi:hypothetical protein